MSSYKRKRVRKPLSISDARLRLTQAVGEAEKVLLTSEDDNTKLQAVYAMSNAIKSYLKLMERLIAIKEMEAKISRYIDQEYDLSQLTDEELTELERLYIKASNASPEEKRKRLDYIDEMDEYDNMDFNEDPVS